MYQARGPRKGQRFTSTQASRESRFAVVKAALRVRPGIFLIDNKYLARNSWLFFSRVENIPFLPRFSSFVCDDGETFAVLPKPQVIITACRLY